MRNVNGSHRIADSAPPFLGNGPDPTFDRRSRIVERVGWVALTGILAAAAAGLLGGAGPLNPRKITPAARGLVPMADFSTLAYERVVRAHTPTSLVVNVRSSEEPSLRGQFPSRIGISIARDYFTGARLLGILPDPESSLVRDDRVEFIFKTREEEQGAAQVVFDFEIMALGARSATLEVAELPAAPRAERSRFSFRQLVLP
jgi:hypothetical protein